MGSYLGKPGPPSAPARAPVTRRPTQPLHQVHRVQHIHRAHPAPRHRPARRPPNWDPSKPAARRFNEAWRRFPMRRPATSILGPQPSDWWESYLKRSIWSLRHPRAVWSPVTIKIAPPEPSAPPPAPPAEVITLAGSSAGEKTPGPDPCAKEAVLTVLRESQKGRVRLVEPLFAENLDPQIQETRPSAFQALRRNGDPPPYLPQPGPLHRGHRPRTSDPTLHQRPSCTSISSLASRPPRAPHHAQRNAISSSYSSWRKCSEPLKSSSPQAPEWPVKRPEKDRRGHSPVSLAADKPLEDSSSSEPPHPEVPLLFCDPGNPAPQTAGPPLGDAADSDGEERAKSQQSGQAQEATTQATADSGPEKPGVLSPAMLSVDTVPVLASELTVESLKKEQQSPEPLVCPQPTADAISAIQSPLDPPRSLTSKSAPPPGPPSGSQPKAVVLLTPVSTTSPAMDTSQLPSIPEPARPQHSLGDTPAPPTNDLLGKPSYPTPPPPTPLRPAATSTDPTTTPSVGLPPTSDLGAVSSSRVCMTQSVSTYTFKPIFGAVAPLHMGTPPSLQQSSLASPTAPLPGLFQGLVKGFSGAVDPSAPGASKTGTSQSPLDLGRVTVTSVMSSTVATPSMSTSQASLLGATQVITANSTAPTGFVVPPPPPPAQQTVQTGTVLSQVPPSTMPISSSSTTNVGHLGSPVSASAVTTPKQPAWSPSSSSTNPALVTAPRQSAPKRPFQPPAGTPSLPAVGSAPKKPRAALAALSPSSTAGTHPKPALSRSTNLGAQPHQAGSAGSGVVSLVPPSVAGGAVFGSTAPRPFAFGGVETPMDCGESGTGGMGPVTSTGTGAGAFSVQPVPPSGITGPAPPFGGGWSQSATGRGSQSSAFASGGVGLSAGTVTFAGLAVGPFAQGASGPAKNGSGVGTGGPSPAQGALGRSPFRPSAPSFSIGTKSKTPKSREQGHSRRHHGHRK